MDPNRLKLKEQYEQEIRKDMNKVPEEGDAEAPLPVQTQAQTTEKQEPRQVPMFMLYFQIFDNVSKKNIVEFEDFSTSRVKSSLVKKEAKDVLARILATKVEKDTTMHMPSGFENHNWVYQVTKKNWVMMCKISSVPPQEVKKVRNRLIL